MLGTIWEIPRSPSGRSEYKEIVDPIQPDVVIMSLDHVAVPSDQEEHCSTSDIIESKPTAEVQETLDTRQAAQSITSIFYQPCLSLHLGLLCPAISDNEMQNSVENAEIQLTTTMSILCQ